MRDFLALLGLLALVIASAGLLALLGANFCLVLAGFSLIAAGACAAGYFFS